MDFGTRTQQAQCTGRRETRYLDRGQTWTPTPRLRESGFRFKERLWR